MKHDVVNDDKEYLDYEKQMIADLDKEVQQRNSSAKKRTIEERSKS